MERSVDVATGESVAFTYELAGLGSRFVAVGIDIGIQVGVLLLLLGGLAVLGSLAPPNAAPPKLGKVERAVATAFGSFALFALFFGYFIAFEIAWAGRTPGKRLLGLRVVRDGGFPLDATSAVVRNVVRMLEVGLGFYIVAAIATLVSPRNQRLGDMAAGTIVVRDGRYERAATSGLAAARRASDSSGDVVAALTSAERDLIRRYALRRATLSSDARANVASRIAPLVRPKLTASFAHLSDDDLLIHLATTALGGA